MIGIGIEKCITFIFGCKYISMFLNNLAFIIKII